MTQYWKSIWATITNETNKQKKTQTTNHHKKAHWDNKAMRLHFQNKACGPDNLLLQEEIEIFQETGWKE